MKIRQIIYGVVLAYAMTACSKYDDSALQNRLDTVENKIEAIETLISGMNSDVTSLKAIADAYHSGSYVQAVTEVKEGDTVIGYKISFTGDRAPITVTLGKDAENGEDGHYPVIGVRFIDGYYYWTVDGELLKDGEGKNVPATDNTALQESLNGVTPVITVEDGKWVITTGTDRKVLDDVIDTEEALVFDGVFRTVDDNSEDVSFTLADGTVMTLPKYVEFRLTLSEHQSGLAVKVDGAAGALKAHIISDSSWTCTCSFEADGTGYIVLDEGSGAETEAVFHIIVTDGRNTATATFNLKNGGLVL